MNIKTDSNINNMRDRPLVFLDLETTGLEIQKHEIIEIGALKVQPEPSFDVLAELEIKVKPEKLELADKDALKLVGFNEKKWEGAISLKEALEQLDEFARGGVLVGYNVNFDWAALDRAYHFLGRVDPFYYHRLDVMPMVFLKFYDNQSLKRFSLGEISRHFKIKREAAHNALDDAKTTYLVFKRLFAKVKKRGRE